MKLGCSQVDGSLCDGFYDMGQLTLSSKWKKIGHSVSLNTQLDQYLTVGELTRIPNKCG